MQLLFLPSLLATAMISTITPVSALSYQKLANYCNVPLYVQYTGSGESVGPLTVPAKGSQSFNITGTGNTLKVQKSSYFGGTNPQMSFGTSTTGGTLYWAVNDVNGDPFAGSKWNVTSTGSGAKGLCGGTTSYGSTVYACSDNNILLTIFACYALAPGGGS